MELLAPAGGREALIAAVQNGADAVYLGAGAFNARRSADNFDGDNLREAVDYCHQRGVKVYVTLNTMVRQDELAALEDAIKHIYMSGADAAIVQDMGVAEAVRRVAPKMALHASTQMAVHNRQGVEYLAKQGFDRVVLAREMEFEEIYECSKVGVELEVFGHGALCVSCSGQCLMSSIIGGRSGNRGMCAQPCRLPYEMNGVEGHLLSPRDLMSADIIDKYIAAGTSSLKIEGRLKRPEYVAVVTGVYRRAIDGKKITENDVNELRQIFNRGGFTHGYGPGAEEKTLMYRVRPNNAGVVIGRCDKKGRVKLEKDVESADMLELQGRGGEKSVKISGSAGQIVQCDNAMPGDRLVRLVSDAQLRAARESYAGENRVKRANAYMKLRVGQPACLTVVCGGESAGAEGGVVEPARGKPLDRERVIAQLKKTGGTVYEIAEVELDGDDTAFIPVSELNRLRREALEKLASLTTGHARVPGRMGDTSAEKVEQDKCVLRAQSGNVQALIDALKNGADEAVFAPEDMRRLDDGLVLDEFYLALPQVMRAEELERINAWAKMHADRIKGVYLSNVSHMGLEWPGMRLGDHAMNIANNLSLRWSGFEMFTPSVELTARQIDMLGGKKDVIVCG
ncbi:MAG: U32 family peptidase, partial [Clostridia bacterium]|nr:U32 family peptidase [Clostridia bacterium]